MSTIPAALYRATPKQVRLQPSFFILCQYDGTALPAMGEIVVEVSHGQQLVKGRFIIVEKVFKLAYLIQDEFVMLASASSSHLHAYIFTIYEQLPSSVLVRG